MMMRRQGFVMIASLLGIIGVSHSGWAETEGTVESRGLNLPRVTAPAPPAPPATPPAAPSFPETTKTPSPGGPIPIPYPNMSGKPLAPELATISSMLADGKPTNVILKAWKGYVTRQVQAKKSINVPQTVQQIQRQAEAQVKARTELEKARLSSRLHSIGDDAQLANVDLQNLLQKQQQMLQMISNISKAMHDTATSIIRNLKG
jgi:hypothetical protein